MTNIDLVRKLFYFFQKIQVTDIIICPGARNLPFVKAFDSYPFKIQSYFEERSAGFFALGKIKSMKKPVVIITTSGTAVAELLPAVIEAFYQNLPLIIVSADRPKSYRGTGAPQSIEQVGIFSQYVQSIFDWDIFTTNFSINYSFLRPVQFNICFDEPLVNQFESDDLENKVELFTVKIDSQLKLQSNEKIKINQPVALISEIEKSSREFVVDFLIKNKIPHSAEFLSGIRNWPGLQDLQIQNSDKIFHQYFKKNKNANFIRIGGIPTHRFWRDLEFEFKNIKVFSFSALEFTGLSRESLLHSIVDLNNVDCIGSEISSLQTCSFPDRLFCPWGIFFEEDSQLQNQKNKLLIEYSKSEQSFIHRLSIAIKNKPLYLGNSLPIRMWDQLSPQDQTDQFVFAHRGANGIDGQISGYLGWAENKMESWCVVGDLTALYDLASLGLVRQFKNQKNKYRIVIINNSGGQIFNRLFGDEKYLNSQDVEFEYWAKMWRWDYLKINNPRQIDDLSNLNAQKIIIEIQTDNSQTALFWKAWDMNWKE